MARVRRRRIGAAIDIGSYSVHLLVAEVRGSRLVELHDESAFLGLGATIDATGEIGPAGATLVDTLVTFTDRARVLGAPTVSLVGTDPLRRAPDAAAVMRAIRAATGSTVAVLSHEEEAHVALLGVLSGMAIERETVVVDVGGGSTEVLLARPGEAPSAVGLPLGAARLTQALVQGDPPTAEELWELRAAAVEAFRSAPPAEPADLIAVGGTARSLLRVGPQLPNRMLTRRRIERAVETIRLNPASTVATDYQVRLSRAHVLAAGAAILLAAMDRYGMARLRVAKGGIREGLILAEAQAGPRWRERLVDLAVGRLGRTA